MIIRAVLFFFVVCFCVWGIFYGTNEILKVPGLMTRTLKMLAIAVGTAAIAFFIITTIVMLF